MREATEAGETYVSLDSENKLVYFNSNAFHGNKFLTKEAREAGYSCKEARDAGYSCEEARDAGYSCEEARDAGYSLQEWRNGGYTGWHEL